MAEHIGPLTNPQDRDESDGEETASEMEMNSSESGKDDQEQEEVVEC